MSIKLDAISISRIFAKIVILLYITPPRSVKSDMKKGIPIKFSSRRG
jgi:hypothetical protein